MLMQAEGVLENKRKHEAIIIRTFLFFAIFYGQIKYKFWINFSGGTDGTKQLARVFVSTIVMEIAILLYSFQYNPCCIWE